MSELFSRQAKVLLELFVFREAEALLQSGGKCLVTFTLLEFHAPKIDAVFVFYPLSS